MKNITAALAVLGSTSQYLCLLCCIVPTATGILALIAGMGGASTMVFGDLSAALHPWRSTIIYTSIALITLSWGLWIYNARKIKAGCGCDTQKQKFPIFLSLATGLLAFNFITVEVIHD